jgi:hypothetical protein
MTGIAKIMKYSTPTISLAIERTFNMRATDYLHERKEEGTALMREAIYEAGLKGNIIAQIFWLKNRDGWSDRQQVTHEILLCPEIRLSKIQRWFKNFLKQAIMKITNVFTRNLRAYKGGVRLIINQGGQGSSKTFSILQVIAGLCMKEKLLVSICSFALPHLKAGCMRDWEKVLESFGVNFAEINKKT